MKDRVLKGKITPLKKYLQDLVEESVPSFHKKRQRWNETLTGLAVVIKFQPLEHEISPGAVCQGIRDVEGCLHSEHTVKNLLQVMNGKGLLIKVSTGPVKRPTSYLLNFDIPGDVLA